MNTSDSHTTFEKINRETAKISWEELQPHYARGALIAVAGKLDLVQVALVFSRDDRRQVEDWLASGKVSRVSEDQARDWAEANPDFWAVVVAPWVLIQTV